MSLSVSTLTDYVKENEQQLITGSVLESKTAALVNLEGNVMVGVKNAEQINEIDTDAVFQNGEACGFNASGTTTISQRKVTVGNIKVNESLCYKTLNKKYLSKALSAGSKYRSEADAGRAFAETYTQKKVDKIKEAIETGLWQGDTGSGTNNLSYYDGLIKIIKATNTPIISNARVGTGTITAATNSTAVTGVGTAFTAQVAVGDTLYSGTTLLGTVATVTNATTIALAANSAAAVTGGAFNIVNKNSLHFAAPITSITTSNVIAVLQGVYSLIPKKIIDKPDLRIFVGMDVFVKYTLALTNANLFHYVAEKDVMSRIKLHGTNVMIEAVPGLNDTNEIYAMRLSNIFIGTDLMDEEEKFEFFYAKEADEVRFVAEFKIGIQVAFPDEITRFQLLAA